MGHGEDFDDSDSELTSIEDSQNEDQEGNEDQERPKILLRTVTSDLPEPRQKRFSTESIFTAEQNKRIDLDPPYQRDIVWTRSQQSYFVHSLLHNYGSGQILFSVGKVWRGEQWVVVKTCIDGKQRLTSIILFMKGELDCKDPKTMESIWYKADPNDPSQRTRKVLDEESRLTWNEKQVWCSEYENLSDAQQREVFKRVQEGMPLTWQETLKAIATPRAQFVNTLKERIFRSAGFHATCPTKWDVDRGLDFQHTACVVYMISKYHNKSPAKEFEPSPKRLEPWLMDEKSSIPTELIEPINTAVDIFMFLATSPETKKIFFKAKKQFGCREFGSIACFIFHWMNTLTMAQLSQGISKVRGDVGAKRALWMYLRCEKAWKSVLGEFPVGTPAKVAIRLLQTASDSVTSAVPAPIATLAGNTTSEAAPPVACTTTSRAKRKLDAPPDKGGEAAASTLKPANGESPKKRSRAAVAGERSKEGSTSKAASVPKVADVPPIAPTQQRPPKRKRTRIVTDDEDAPAEGEGEAPPPKHPRTGGEDASNSPRAGQDTMAMVTESRPLLPGAQKDQIAGLSNMTTVLKRQAGRGSGTKSSAATKSKAKTKAPTEPQLPPPIPRTGRPASFKQLKIPKYSDPPKPAASPQLPVSYPSPVSRTTTPAVNSPRPPPQPPLPQTTFAVNSAPNANARQSPSIDARMQQVLPRDSSSPITTESGRLDRVRRNRDQASANVASATSILPLAPVPNTHPSRIPDSATSASAPRPQATTDPRRRPPLPIQIPPSIGKLESSSSSSSGVVPLDLSKLLQPMQEKHYFSSPSVSPLPRVRPSPTIPQYGDNFGNAPSIPYRTSSANTIRSELLNSVPTSQQQTSPNTSQLPPRLQPHDFPAGVGVPVASTVAPHHSREQHRSLARSTSNSETDVHNQYASPFYQLVEPGNIQPLTGDQLQVAREMKRKTSWERSQGGVH